jgi:hypothetical protein
MVTEAGGTARGAGAARLPAISVISQSFEKLPVSSKIVHAASLGCITLAVILLMAPAAYDRIVFSGQDTEEVHRVGSWSVTGATVPLALGLAGDVYVVFAVIAAPGMIAVFVAGIALVFLVDLWHAFPLVRRLRRLRCSG